MATSDKVEITTDTDIATNAELDKEEKSEPSSASFKLPALPSSKSGVVPETLSHSEKEESSSHPTANMESEGSDSGSKPFLAPFKLPTLPLKKTQKEIGSVTKSSKTEEITSSKSNLEPTGQEDIVKEPASSVQKSQNSENVADSKKDTRGTGTSQKKRHKRIEPSPAEKLNIPPLPYKEPSWGGIADKQYSLEILKGGKIVDTVALNDKQFYVFGRLENCDITLEHPSISRYHMVLQYRAIGDSERDPGFYLYDLGSTHGSQFNKGPMKSRAYYRIRVGHQFKLGGSTRIFILQGPSEDEEVVAELSVTQLKELKRRQLQEQEELKGKKETENEEDTRDDEGISWGMGEDAEEEIDMDKNPYNVMSQAEKEASYVKDPKKTLRGYFEREGIELEYKVEEKGSSFNHQYVCRVELPIDDADGEPIIAEAAVSGKKKESVVACAMEACRILDAHGVLRQAIHESKSKKKKNWADDDYYDSDDDSYLDRTGVIEKKREKRMMKAGVIKQEVDTYDSLMEKLKKVTEEIEQNQKELEVLKQEQSIRHGDTMDVFISQLVKLVQPATVPLDSQDIKQSTGPEEDTLDAFISQLKSGKTVDKTRRAKMKLHLIELKKEQSRLQRLIKLVQPATVPLDSQSQKPASNFAALSQRLPMKGFMKGRKIPATKPKVPGKVTVPESVAVSRSPPEKEDIEEEEEEEEMEDEQESVKAEDENGSEDNAVIGRLAQPDLNNQKVTEDMVPDNGGDTRQPEPKDPSTQRRPKRVIGPQMGPLIKFKQFMDRDEPEDDASEGPEVKKKKEKDYTDWIPPDDQKGDGRTFLNDKFGY